MRDIPPIHPGEHLAEFLEEYNLSQYALAKRTGMAEIRVSEIIRGKRSITADTALRLGRFFTVEPEFWLNLQSRYDLELAGEALGGKLEQEVQVYQPIA